MSDYIPPELIPNILARLAVDDVVRCTSVCKSWYSLITSPSFASLHLNLSSPNQEHRVLVKYYRDDVYYCLHSDNQTFDEIAELDVPVSFRDNEWMIADSVNGLVCLYDWLGCGIVLWNLSLRKLLILPNSRVLYRGTIGFGFVATSNDYMIIKYSSAYKRESLAEIYKLSTGSWRDLKLEDPLNFDVRSGQAHLNGILHWSGRSRGEVSATFSNCICSFDIEKEKFSTLMFPSCLRNDDAYITLSTFEESLCLIDKSNGFVKIWVLKEYGVADSWENLFVINMKEHNLTSLFYFRHNGEIIFTKPCRRSGRDKMVSYDRKINWVKYDLLENCYITWVYTYVESLVLIKDPNEVKSDDESTNILENIRGFSGLLLNVTKETRNATKLDDHKIG